MSTGKLQAFDLDKDSWSLYIERLEQYFIVNDIKQNMQVPTLITLVGSDTYELMVNLCTPDKPAKKSFNELVKLMSSYLQPKPSELAERFKFRQCVQAESETVAEYAARLKKMSKNCGFDETSLKENLRDQLVCGLRSDYVRQRLFTEVKITFDTAFSIASSMETAEADASVIEKWSRNRSSYGATAEARVLTAAVARRGWDSAPRHRETSAGRGRAGAGGRGFGDARRAGRLQSGPAEAGSSATRTAQEVSCGVCGGRHDDTGCKFKRYVCRVCNREGHLKRMCPKLKGKHSTSIHALEEGATQNTYYDTLDADNHSDEVNNYSLQGQHFSKFKPYKVDVCIENKVITMEIDTGSAISCISLSCYQKYFSNCTLQDSNLILRYYTGETVKPIGKFTPLVTCNNKSQILDLYVVQLGKTNLLGRQWLSVLQINVPVSTVFKVDGENGEFNFKEFSSRYCEVFADGLGRFTGGTVGFQLRPGARPVFLRARPLAYALREPVERALDALVKDGVISPVSASDWATPIVPVMKKDGTIRVCGDFKMTLNKCLEIDRFPLPRVEDLLAKLHGGVKFTKIDLSQAYAQFELDDSRQYTVINTHKGLFRYNRLIYGLASSPGIFQRKLEELFADMPRVGIFLDDLIITGSDNASHLNTLHEVFKRLNKYGLKIRKDKCTFFADSVTYLGFVISKHGVHTCPEKLEAIKKVKTPINISELRSFLGLVMYYARFIPNISSLLSPLYALLKKGIKYEWSDECKLAFEAVKTKLMSSEVLAHYSPELPLVLTTDASGAGVGAVISHLTEEGERPIAYASRVLNSAEKGYAQIEREALAIIYGVRKFHQYLYGRKFILRTDHKPLVSIFGNKSGIPIMAASRMQRWAVILGGYTFDIEYVRSEKNAADALSRLPVGEGKPESEDVTYLNFVQKYLPVTRKTVVNNITKDEILKKVFWFIQNGWPNKCEDETLKPFWIRRNELYLDLGCIVWGYRLVIPTTLRETLLNELHVGHLGIVKMKSIARSWLWWPGIDTDIEAACRRCSTCAAEAPAPPRAPPQHWPYHATPWTRLHVDFLSIDSKTFLVIMDSTSKWLEVFLMHRTTATAVIKVLRETFARFGLPQEIVSDNGPPFSSKEYADFMSMNGIKVSLTAIYHPSSNGAAESAVKLCKRAIKKSFRDGCDLDAALQSYLMAYRNVDHCTTGTSPAMLLQRRKLRSRLDLLRGDRMIEDRVREEQERQVSYAGGVRRDLDVGDTVWARNYTGGSKWLDGQVKQKLGSRSYIIERDNELPIKRHIDQLRKRWVHVDSQSFTPATSARDSQIVPAAPAEDHLEPATSAAAETAPADAPPSVTAGPASLDRPATGTFSTH